MINRSIPEKDWKQLKKLKSEMLDMLCLKINQQAENIIIQSCVKSEHEKYLDLYKHIQYSDGVVAKCFNDWKRSNIIMKISQLLAEDLLTDEHIQNLSDDTKELINLLKSL